jgi:hypothetical protein
MPRCPDEKRQARTEIISAHFKKTVARNLFCPEKFTEIGKCPLGIAIALIVGGIESVLARIHPPHA